MRRTQLEGALAVALILALLSACHGRETLRQEPVPNPSGFTVQWVHAPSLDYNSFSDPTGHIRDEHVAAAQAMVQDPERLERVYEDAVQGNARAARVFLELETRFFPDIGRAVAEQTASLSCSVPVYRELSGACIPNWAFIDFLQRDMPGGVRLRKALGDAYEVRARALGVKNALIVNALNALMAGVIIKGTLAGTAGSTVRRDWPPKPPEGPKPPLDAPEAARWRYERYVYDQHAGGKQPGEVLDFERWKSTYFDSVVKGGRPGRAGGPSQVATRQRLATEEGYINSESTRLGDKVVDMYRSNAQGGIDYVEVDSILQNGLPRAAMREKLKVELRALGQNDTLLIVDKEEPLKRILYRFGEDASVVDTRRVGGE